MESKSIFKENETRYFKSEKERDAYLRRLNKSYGTDQFGNNLSGYVKTAIHTEKVVGHFIFGIIHFII